MRILRNLLPAEATEGSRMWYSYHLISECSFDLSDPGPTEEIIVLRLDLFQGGLEDVFIGSSIPYIIQESVNWFKPVEIIVQAWTL